MPNGKALQAATSHDLGQNFLIPLIGLFKTKIKIKFIPGKIPGAFLPELLAV